MILRFNHIGEEKSFILLRQSFYNPAVGFGCIKLQIPHPFHYQKIRRSLRMSELRAFFCPCCCRKIFCNSLFLARCPYCNTRLKRIKKRGGQKLIRFYFCKDCQAVFSLVIVDDSEAHCYRCNSHNLTLTKTVTSRRTRGASKKQSPDLPDESVTPCDGLEAV